MTKIKFVITPYTELGQRPAYLIAESNIQPGNTNRGMNRLPYKPERRAAMT